MTHETCERGFTGLEHSETTVIVRHHDCTRRIEVHRVFHGRETGTWDPGSGFRALEIIVRISVRGAVLDEVSADTTPITDVTLMRNRTVELMETLWLLLGGGMMMG